MSHLFIFIILGSGLKDLAVIYVKQHFVYIFLQEFYSIQSNI